MVEKDCESSAPDHTADTNYDRASNNESPFVKESALIEYMITEYTSLADSVFDLGFADTRYERPRAAPAVPKRDLPNALKQADCISMKRSTKAESVSRNFRRLRLDTHHTNRPLYRSRSDQDSPDWACQTSLAIEAGEMGIESAHTNSSYSKSDYESPDWACQTSLVLEAGTISTDSVHSYCGYSSPRHILDTMRSPTRMLLPQRKRVQSLGTRDMQVAHSSPFSRHSWTHSSGNKDFEGALQFVSRAKAPQPVGRYRKIESTIGERPTRHEHVQVAPPIDLNKSLPALPWQPCEQNEKEHSESR